MPMIARYVASYAGYEAGTDPAATGAESGPMAVGEVGGVSFAGADYGEVLVTVSEAVTAVAQAQGYIQALTNDYVAWVTPLDASPQGLTVAEESLWNGFRAFVNGWRSFYDANFSSPPGWLSVLPLASAANALLDYASFTASTRSVRDTANNYLDQAGQWRDKLVAVGGAVSTPTKPPPVSGSQFNWPSLSDVPWWVWLLGAAAVAAWLGIPQSIAAAWRGSRALPARRTT